MALKNAKKCHNVSKLHVNLLKPKPTSQIIKKSQQRSIRTDFSSPTAGKPQIRQYRNILIKSVRFF